MSHPYRNVAVLGAFNTKQARSLPTETSLSIALKAAKGAIHSTGIDVDEIDGVFGDTDVGYHLGLNAYTTTPGTGVGIVLAAADAIAAGRVTTALVVSGGAGLYTERASTAPWTRPANEWVVPFGLYTAVEFALIARRHMITYGTTAEQMATVAATIRNHGRVTPGAVYYGAGPFTADDVLSSRMIADPFHLLDCATTSEGGCAMILSTASRSKDAKLPPVRILGGGTERLGPYYQFPPAWDLSGSRRPGFSNGQIGRKSAQHAFRAAGLSPSDVDVAELYDPFSFEIIRQLEAFGFCEPGEGGEFVMSAGISIDGALPVTTDGGTMSYSHAGTPQGLQRVARAATQVQGLCETNQVAGAEVALASAGGAGALFTDVVVLGKEL